MNEELTERQKRILSQFCSETLSFPGWQLFDGQTEKKLYKCKTIQIKQLADGRWSVYDRQRLLATCWEIGMALVTAYHIADISHCFDARADLQAILLAFVRDDGGDYGKH